MIQEYGSGCVAFLVCLPEL